MIRGLICHEGNKTSSINKWTNSRYEQNSNILLDEKNKRAKLTKSGRKEVGATSDFTEIEEIEDGGLCLESLTSKLL